jgi:hypothetical protein
MQYIFAIFAVIMTLVQLTLAVFYIVSNSAAITTAFGDHSQQKNALRNLRSANLGLGVAGIFYVSLQ